MDCTNGFHKFYFMLLLHECIIVCMLGNNEFEQGKNDPDWSIRNKTRQSWCLKSELGLEVNPDWRVISYETIRIGYLIRLGYAILEEKLNLNSLGIILFDYFRHRVWSCHHSSTPHCKIRRGSWRFCNLVWLKLARGDVHLGEYFLICWLIKIKIIIYWLNTDKFFRLVA